MLYAGYVEDTGHVFDNGQVNRWLKGSGRFSRRSVPTIWNRSTGMTCVRRSKECPSVREEIFADSQIILSTREDVFKKYIRYKYDRYGLEHTALPQVEMFVSMRLRRHTSILYRDSGCIVWEIQVY